MLKGSYPALITPFANDGSLDEPALKRLLSWHADTSSAGWVLLGSTAEALGLLPEERERVLTLAGTLLPKERVLVGIAGPSTQAVIANAQQAKSKGFDKVLLVTPYYMRPSQEELVRQVQQVAAATDCDIVIYTVPPRTGVDYTDETILRLAAMDRVIGLKDAGADIMRVERIKKQLPKGFSYLSGDDHTTLLRLFGGADGVISVCANVVPDTMQAMCRHADAHSWQEAKALHTELQPYFTAMSLGGNPAVIKYLAAKKWQFPYRLRAPLESLPGAVLEKINTLINNTA